MNRRCKSSASHKRSAKLLEDADVPLDRVAGVGVGCPGPLDIERGLVHLAPNLGWVNVDVKKELEKTFRCPVVAVNDVDAGVYGEYRFGAGQKARCLLGVFPGTGIGGGCVYEGRIFHGQHITCMEIGHLQILPDGPRCGCGRIGCVEAVASRLAISAAAAQAVYRGQAPHLEALAGTDLSEIRSGVLAEAIKAGDVIIEQIIRRAAEQIGVAIADVVNLLAPDMIVLGGGLVEAMPQLFLESVGQSVRLHVLPAYEKGLKLKVAELGDDATTRGAAAWCQEMTVGAGRTR